jgi:hypothetical protein
LSRKNWFSLNSNPELALIQARPPQAFRRLEYRIKCRFWKSAFRAGTLSGIGEFVFRKIKRILSKDITKISRQARQERRAEQKNLAPFASLRETVFHLPPICSKFAEEYFVREH